MKHEPCLRCDKAVDVSKRHWRVHIVEGDIDLGWHTIGSECRKHYPDHEIERFPPLPERNPT